MNRITGPKEIHQYIYKETKQTATKKKHSRTETALVLNPIHKWKLTNWMPFPGSVLPTESSGDGFHFQNECKYNFLLWSDRRKHSLSLTVNTNRVVTKRIPRWRHSRFATHRAPLPSTSNSTDQLGRGGGGTCESLRPIRLLETKTTPTKKKNPPKRNHFYSWSNDGSWGISSPS